MTDSINNNTNNHTSPIPSPTHNTINHTQEGNGNNSPELSNAELLASPEQRLQQSILTNTLPNPPTSSVVPPERKRRSHQKSRKGCATCKKRKVKCSEEKPICGQCHKLGLECNYEQRNGARTIAPLPIQEISLMYHWTTVTGPNLLSSLSSSLWVTHVPKLSFDHPFLLRQLLSLTAAHYQESESSDELQSRTQVPVEQYIEDQRSSAFVEFRKILDEGITVDNAEAMVATAILMAIHGFSVETLGVMRMFGGIKFVADELYKVLPDSIFNNMLQPSLEIPELPPSFVLAPLAIGSLHQPIAHLAYIYSLDPTTLSQELIFSWPALLSLQFLDSLDSDPQAQLITYWYFHKLDQLQHLIWWIGTSPARECQKIDEMLIDEYRNLLPNETNQVVQY